MSMTTVQRLASFISLSRVVVVMCGSTVGRPNRGLRDILIACCDGLTGLPEAGADQHADAVGQRGGGAAEQQLP
jgi:hypothetical protein